MIEEDFCPYCDELIKLEFSDDYYMTEQYEPFESAQCPMCDGTIELTWEVKHKIHFQSK